MSRTGVGLGAAFMLFAAASLVAGPIDPQGPDFPDIGADNLALQAAGPICFSDGDNYCLHNLEITGTGTNDQYAGNDETDIVSGAQLSGDLVDMSTNTDYGDWLIPYDGAGSGLSLELPDRSSVDGTFQDDFASFDFSGDLPQIGSFEIQEVGSDNNGSTIFSGPNDGLYNITSFFDVFTDISLDGGNSFINPTNTPANGTEFDLVTTPEPGTFLLLLPGVMLLAYYRSRYKRACASAISRQS